MSALWQQTRKCPRCTDAVLVPAADRAGIEIGRKKSWLHPIAD